MAHSFSTATVPGWEKLFRNQGWEMVEMDDFSEKLDNIQWAMVRELGRAGMARMAWKLLRQPTVAKGLMEWDRIFKEGKRIIGYVGRKAATT